MDYFTFYYKLFKGIDGKINVTETKKLFSFTSSPFLLVQDWNACKRLGWDVGRRAATVPDGPQEVYLGYRGP